MRFNKTSLLYLIIVLCLMTNVSCAQDHKVNQDIKKLVEVAQKRTKLWPWKPAGPEVADVAAHGKEAAPLLVKLLVKHPDTNAKSLGVQQEVALALCEIYGISKKEGHVYMNRALIKTNDRIKAFWKAKVGRH
jgi:hypothetical protein